jgi:aldose 1-epimerase
VPANEDSRSPSGAQHRITHGDQVAVVTEVGATLRQYDVGGRRLVDGFAPDTMADGGRGQVLVPWPNRVRDGRWTWEGEDLQLSISEVGGGNAIHGLVRWVGWSTEEHSTDAVTLSATVWPSPGYPFRLGLTATYRLDDDGLSVRLVARNQGDRPAPYGVGQHPYLTAGTDLADDTVLTVPGNVRLLTDDRGTPVGREGVDGSPYDFREGRQVGDLRLDTAYTDLMPDDDGRVRVRLENPAGGGVGLWAGPTTRWLQVFTGDTLAADRRRRSFAVEPMSCPPGALASGEDLVVLAINEEHVLEWGIHSW